MWWWWRQNGKKIWVDARSRLAYNFFGDVTFDTTYKTNKCNMPFAPLLGWLIIFNLSYLVVLCCKMRPRNLSNLARGNEWKMSCVYNKISRFGNQICSSNVISLSDYAYGTSSKFREKLSHIFIVYVDLDTNVSNCCCQLSEYMGILCRHSLVIFQAKNVVDIPSNILYIFGQKMLTRALNWMKMKTKFLWEW